MPKFFVGQRVRILYSLGWPELKGKEGRVALCNAENTNEKSPTFGKLGYEVAPDVWGTQYAPRPSSSGGAIFTPLGEQLEPILPEGHKAGDFSYEELLDHLKELSHENA